MPSVVRSPCGHPLGARPARTGSVGIAQEEAAVLFAAQDKRQREQAMTRLAVLRPHLEDGVSLTASYTTPRDTTGRKHSDTSVVSFTTSENSSLRACCL